MPILQQLRLSTLQIAANLCITRNPAATGNRRMSGLAILLTDPERQQPYPPPPAYPTHALAAEPESRAVDQ